MKQFDSLLVANRGEIAVRVIRSAQLQGYKAIAVYSEADIDAPHVAMADESVLIGAAPVKESYLDADKILEAARKTGAQAIHPGYGFLSENAEFAQLCEKEGIVFIGPSAQAIRVMGNKAESKRRMIKADVPCIPGYEDFDQSDETLLAAAKDIGVPIMVKAAAGGGGRGMRLVENMDDLLVALSSARSEAENAFGSGELILEKAVMRPRHVEIQVFGDQQGNVVHLGERDCSVQRRHQKVVEESPCPVMTPKLRQEMGEAAVSAAKSINYVGAGTVEFLLDDDSNFYFLEMNTRLQVEHPVTEMVTGLDLVALQFKVAQGYPLGLTQDDISLSGHAIEVRLYAEDTSNDFLPATGSAQVWKAPVGEGIRVDHGLAEGQDISPFYDPMIAKVIAWGEDRDIARRRLVRALEKTCLFGLDTNREFLIDVLNNTAFANGEATTAFIGDEYQPDDLKLQPASQEQALIAAVLQYRQGYEQSDKISLNQGTKADIRLFGWSSGCDISTCFQYELQENKIVDISVTAAGSDQYELVLDGQTHCLQILDDSSAQIRLLIDSVQKKIYYHFPSHGEVTVQQGGVARTLRNMLAFTKADEDVAMGGTVVAPMHGNVLEVFVKVGEQVEEGQRLAVMEAMKMEHQLIAAVSGEVVAVNVMPGDQVAAGAVFIDIDEAEQAD